MRKASDAGVWSRWAAGLFASALVLAIAATTIIPVDGRAAGQQDAPPATDQKVQVLFVQSAESAVLEDGTLTLEGISPTTIYFSDRPYRLAGHIATTEMLTLWSEGSDSFTKDPPNATLSAFKVGGEVVNAVLELSEPAINGNRMTYHAKVLEGTVPGGVEGVSLFIDVIGMPLTPVSYAGAARRAYRGAVIY